MEEASEGVRTGQKGGRICLSSWASERPPAPSPPPPPPTPPLFPPSLPPLSDAWRWNTTLPEWLFITWQMEISTRASSPVKWEGSVAPARSSPPPPPPRQLCATLQAIGRSLFYPLRTFVLCVVGLLFRRHPTTNITPFRSQPEEILR